MRMNAFIALSVFFLMSSCQKQKEETPNVIVILLDDLGYADVGFNGAKDILTPHIDELAEQSVVFDNAYVSYPVCSPSRAGLLTGRYQDHFGYGLNVLFAPKDEHMGLPKTEFTLADLFKTKNYTTSAIGKWHLGAHESLRPRQRGFDEFFGFLSGGHRYFPHEWILEDETAVKSQYDAYKTKLLKNGSRVEENEYLTDALSREAVDFIGRNSNQPFFLYLSYNAPHSPLQATQKYLDRYEHLPKGKRKTYAAMVSAVDDGVGAIVNALKEHQIKENTIIYFLSDNGGSRFNGSQNTPLRGHKGELFEGGIKVPFFMHWPTKLEGGRRYQEPIIALDIFATLKSIVHPDLSLPNEIQGTNLMPYLTDINEQAPHPFLFWRNNGHQPPLENGSRPRYITWSVRTPDTKLLIRKSDTMLFDMKYDRSETNNLKDSLSREVELLDHEIQKWNAFNVDPVFMGLKDNKRYNELHPDRFTQND